ncbi:MAG: tRNA threonylcarbamoyladenosine dehydratase [Bacteroidales bacterium]|nr:tRNA threonylcarbamoyladenosine dehydratase [Bacteroidales bacterium]
MTNDQTMYTRTKLLLKDEGLARLQSAHVLVVGLGGVGGYAAEQLCRAGVGELTIVDGDTVAMSNKNRQIIALDSTLGQPKAEVLGQRLHDINPDCKLHIINEFLRDERMIEILQQTHFDYVVDAIDTLSPKVFLIYHTLKAGYPLVSSMGSAGKLDPTLVEVSDVAESHTCPLAHMVRKRLSHLGVKTGFKVVFSPERVPKHACIEDPSTNKRTTIGTISYMPPVFGCVCASVVIRDLVEEKSTQ